MDLIERERKIAELFNRTPGKLTGYDCPVCLNRGNLMDVRKESGRIYRFLRECECVKIRKSIREIERSGLAPLMGECTFDTWEEREPWQQRAKKLATEYAAKPDDGWFVMAGSVGAGKTHLCTAVCGELLKRAIPVRYVLWRDLAVQAKAILMDREAYQALVAPLKRVKVLYIDDLFKTGKSGSGMGIKVTDGDVNLAYEILNNRSNNGLPTVISSELTVEDITDIDEATGSRIYQRSKGYYIPLRDKANWRLEN